MKIIEALKELPLLEKRINKQADEISVYSGFINSEDPPFGTKEAQKQKVAHLVQSSIDLATRYEQIKRALAITNTGVTVEIEGQKKTIAEWIVFRQKSGQFVGKVLSSQTLDHALGRLKQVQMDVTEGVKVERMYDEESRNKALEKLQNTIDKVDGVLEVINATTDLLVEV